MTLFVRSSLCLLRCARRTATSMAVGKASEGSEPGFIDSPVTQKTRGLAAVLRSGCLITEILQKNKKIEDSQWASLRQDLLDRSLCREVNVDAKISDICLYYRKLDEVLSYFKFLKGNNYNLNLTIKGTYLRMFHVRQKPLTKEEEDEILSIYDGIRKQHSILDAKTATDCALALSHTKRWKDAFELVDMIKITSDVKSTVPSALIVAALRNNDEKLAWKLLNDYEQNQAQPYVYKEYLGFCLRNFVGEKLLEQVEKIFYFWRVNDVQPQKYVIQEYVDLYKSLGYPVNYTKILQRASHGHCCCCNYQLQPTTLSPTDFKVLSVSILKLIVVGENLYAGTTPEELQKYRHFIKNMKPYDVVIDGLNVAYVGSESRRGKLETILEAIEMIQKNGKKRILVFGRTHMKYWCPTSMKQIMQQADTFFVQNASQDDPFLLHLSIISGHDTYFVSNDLMRQHKAKLRDPSLKRLFKRWQLSRQYYFKKLERSFGLTLVSPMKFQVNAQNDGNGWHIPYSESRELMLPDKYEVPETWVCLKTKKSKDR
ncbi:hypothetical protein QAD02_016294 [Eretmocerus hayati]|uniref:Uncharacterized protein n=1 Tax=Eretmocerus hayati TaxID=131215 RepID=A0ACC2PAP2_9HYME|nr:hypothetical protein QAD02_016294 [Eretmocerus hayati]